MARNNCESRASTVAGGDDTPRVPRNIRLNFPADQHIPWKEGEKRVNSSIPASLIDEQIRSQAEISDLFRFWQTSQEFPAGPDFSIIPII